MSESINRPYVSRPPEQVLGDLADAVRLPAFSLAGTVTLEQVQYSLIAVGSEPPISEDLGIEDLPDDWRNFANTLDKQSTLHLLATLLIASTRGDIDTLARLRRTSSSRLLKIEGIGPRRATVLKAFGHQKQPLPPTRNLWVPAGVYRNV